MQTTNPVRDLNSYLSNRIVKLTASCMVVKNLYYYFQEDMNNWIDNILLICTDASDNKDSPSQGETSSCPTSPSNIDIGLSKSFEGSSESSATPKSNEKSPAKKINFFKKK